MESQRSCIGLPGGTPDQRIAACTALLETPNSTPNVERAFILRALTYEQKGQFDRAIEDYNQYIRLHPTEPDSWLGRCRAASMTSQSSAALSDCEEALRLSVNDPGALYARGLINLKAGRPDAAVRDFTAVLGGQPKNAGAFFLRGTAKLVWRFQSSNHMHHSKRPQFVGLKPSSELSGFMESVV
jgi:tetratricopeptide (TPR) repeat protein